MAESEALKAANLAHKAIQGIKQSLDSIVAKDILTPIRAIDKGEFGDVVLKGNVWVSWESVQAGSGDEVAK